MKRRLSILSFFIAVLILSNHIFSQNTPRDIMREVDTIERKNTEAFTKVVLTSCKFGLKEGNVFCIEKPRKKTVDSIQIHVGKNDEDSKTLMVIRDPANEKGLSILSHSYNSSDVDNETWVYLSAIGKVKRIASGSDEDFVEPSSIFGSEFTTEDLENGKIDDYTYTLLETVNYIEHYRQ